MRVTREAQRVTWHQSIDAEKKCSLARNVAERHVKVDHPRIDTGLSTQRVENWLYLRGKQQRASVKMVIQRLDAEPITAEQ